MSRRTVCGADARWTVLRVWEHDPVDAAARVAALVRARLAEMK